IEYYANVAAGGALMGCIYALIAAGLTLVFGVMRMVNIAHGEMVVIGMYIGYWAYELAGLSTLPALLIAAPTLFLFGYVLQHSVVNRMLEQPIQMQFLLYISLALIIT